MWKRFSIATIFTFCAIVRGNAGSLDIEQCSANRFLSEIGGDNLFAIYDRSISRLSQKSFDGKFIRICRWNPTYKQEILLCASEFGRRYGNLVAMYPPARSKRLEEMYLRINEASYLFASLEIKYSFDGTKIEVTDVQVMNIPREINQYMNDVSRKLNNKSAAERVDWYRGLFSELGGIYELYCSLADKKDSEFKKAVEQFR